MTRDALTTILLALSAGDPRWQQAFDDVTTYLNDLETLGCVNTQREICNDAGLAPHKGGGSLLGDLYAKSGDAVTAKSWYTLATLLGGASGHPWPFQALADARLADVDARVARYLDADPDNDDPVVGVGEQNCAVCHNR